MQREFSLFSPSKRARVARKSNELRQAPNPVTSSAHAASRPQPSRQAVPRRPSSRLALWPPSGAGRAGQSRAADRAAAGDPGRGRTPRRRIRRPQSPQILSRDELAQRLPAGAVHQGLAVLAAPLEEPALEDVLARCGDDALVLALDQVTDPHNVGAILRSAAAFGAAGVIVTERHAPADTGVLAKAASGALEIVPLMRAVNLARTLEQLKEAGFWTLRPRRERRRADRHARPQGPGLHRARRRGRGPAPADRREMRPAGDDSDPGGVGGAQRFQCRRRRRL